MRGVGGAQTLHDLVPTLAQALQRRPLSDVRRQALLQQHRQTVHLGHAGSNLAGHVVNLPALLRQRDPNRLKAALYHAQHVAHSELPILPVRTRR